MAWVAVAGAAVSAIGSAYGASQQRKGANRAAQAQQQAAQQAIEEQRRMYEQTQANLAPYMQAGTGSLAQMVALNGGDFSSFTASPDYQWAREQGLDAIDHRAAARGGLFGGGNTRDAMRYASGLASQNYNNYYSKLAGLAGMGQSSASDLGRFGAAMASNNGQALLGAGQARASAYQQIGDTNAQLGGAIGNGISGLIGNWGAGGFGGSGSTGGGSWNGQALPGQTMPNQPGWGGYIPGNQSGWRG